MSLSELSYSVLEKKYDNFITPAMVMKINNIPISKLPGIYVSQVQVQLSLESSCSASFTLEKVYDLEKFIVTIYNCYDEPLKGRNNKDSDFENSIIENRKKIF